MHTCTDDEMAHAFLIEYNEKKFERDNKTQICLIFSGFSPVHTTFPGLRTRLLLSPRLAYLKRILNEVRF